MSYEQARELVIALIASGRLPMPSFDAHEQKVMMSKRQSRRTSVF